MPSFAATKLNLEKIELGFSDIHPAHMTEAKNEIKKETNDKKNVVGKAFKKTSDTIVRGFFIDSPRFP